MKYKVLFTALILFVVTLMAGSPDVDQQLLKRNWDFALTYGLNPTVQDTVTFLEKGIQGPKSPGKALVFSALIPGAGEFYTGRYLKGAAFLTLESLAWGLKISYNKKGEDLETKYKKFADEHWNFFLWLNNYDPDTDPETHQIWVYVRGVPGFNDGYYSSDSLITFRDLLTDTSIVVVPVKSRDFYENIGKYDQFSKGWDDSYDEEGNLIIDTTGSVIRVTANRNKYLKMRFDSNKYLKRALNITSFIIANHIFSAIDAIISAKQYNMNKEVTWHIRLIPDYYRQKIRGVEISLEW